MNELDFDLSMTTPAVLDAEAKRRETRAMMEQKSNRRQTDRHTALEFANLQLDLGDSNPNDLFGYAAVRKGGKK